MLKGTVMNASRYFSKWTVAVFLLLSVAGVHEVYGQYFSFGKNRVQYNDFDWRYIQSEHFDVYYYQSKNYDMANFAAISMEASLKQLQEDFLHQITDRIKVIVYDSHNDFAQTNVVNLPIFAEGIGGVTDPFKNRITIPFSGNYTEFRSTLQHELVHAVINDMFYGGNVQSIISGRVQLQIPTWFNEGLAEYESIGWDTNTDMYIRDAIINDYLAPISQLSGYYAYRGGQSLWNYIVEQYGRQKIGEIMQTMRNQHSLEAALRQSLGLSLEELSKRWKEYYKKRYFPEVAEREQVDSFGDLLTERGKYGTYNTSPALSPQGDKIAMISNERGGFFDVVVINAITGQKLKTLIKGTNKVQFEEFNILNPNLSWSPDGSKICLSAKTKGSDNLAIVDYNTGKVQKIKFPKLDAMGSVAWSPDGSKIAFDGNIGPFQDIYVYNLQSHDFYNVTNDAFTDYEPAWGPDSQTLYFVSYRGAEVELNKEKNDINLLKNDDLYSSDIYSVKIGSNRATRLTKTPLWNEKQPATTRDGRLVYVSDQNGIENIYELNLNDRTSSPLTDLQTGVFQMSISADGSRLAVNSINEGYLDIFMVRSPFLRKKDSDLKPNVWAQRRASETEEERVPASKYVQQMLATPGLTTISQPQKADNRAVAAIQNNSSVQDSSGQQATSSDTTQSANKGNKDEKNVDFRNYVFETSVQEDTVFAAKYLEKPKFEPEDNTTDDGRYQPRNYRLKFTTDFVYAGGNFSTYYGAYGLTQFVFSDLLGNHKIIFGSNLVFDLRNSDYFLQYGYFKNRTNWLFNFFHSASSYQTYSGQLLRFRTYGGGINAQYPLDTFHRFDFGLSIISLAQDYSIAGQDYAQNETSTFAYPQIIYTKDNTLSGYITPVSGTRYSVSLSASPPLTGTTPQFVSALGDYRKYFNLGYGYSFAVRGSGAASFGRDSQTFFMGGMLGWINQRWAGNSLPVDRLGETFFTLPALPLRGHEYNSIYGDRFTLANAEFRFPLFAAILPGPIPILPLYNMTGVAFIDAGMAWGQKIPYYSDSSHEFYNPASLDFNVQNRREIYVDQSNGDVYEQEPSGYQDNPDQYTKYPAGQGDILIGAGFGLRTILLGLPFRYDIGWPYYRDGFGSHPINYFSIGIDF